MEATDFIRGVNVFSKVDPGQLEPLVEKLRRRTYQRGSVIFHQDDPGDRLHFLVDGLVKICLVAPDGRENDIAFLTPGDCFGEMSVLDGGLRSATAIAAETAETMTLAREDFLEFLEGHTQVALEIIALLVRRLRNMDEMIGDMVFLDVPTRVAKKLLELSQMYQQESGESERLTVPVGQDGGLQPRDGQPGPYHLQAYGAAIHVS